MGLAILCPIRSIWEVSQAITLPPDLLPPSLRGSNLGRVLKAILPRAGIDSTGKYLADAFRRGAAMAFMASGSTLAQTMRSDGWHSQTFRAYSMFQLEEAAIRKLFRLSQSLKATRLYTKGEIRRGMRPSFVISDWDCIGVGRDVAVLNVGSGGLTGTAGFALNGSILLRRVAISPTLRY